MASWRTVHNGSSYRFDKAREQLSLSIKSEEYIFDCVKECMNSIGLDTSRFNSLNDVRKYGPYDKAFYQELKKEYSLVDVRDIVWTKLTKDGYLGVVATSNDINFDRPTDSNDFDKTTENGKWLYTTSGIIICKLGKSWNEDYVLVFPLVGMPSDHTRHRHEIEKRIGDFLIEKDVPIIDFYSHRL